MTEHFTKGELHVIAVMEGADAIAPMPGSFTKALIEAIAKADVVNWAKLHSVFPELADAVLAYQNSDLHERWTRYLEDFERKMMAQQEGEADADANA